MSPSNLGIVFGPTLLRPLVSADMSMLALLETSYQAVFVEFLITHHDKVFGVQQRSQTPPPPVPTAPLPDTPPRASYPLDGEIYASPQHDNASRERPRSLEVSTAVTKRSGPLQVCTHVTATSIEKDQHHLLRIHTYNAHTHTHIHIESLYLSYIS